MLDDKDMIEINLSTRLPSNVESEPHESHCITKSLSITDLKDHGTRSRIANQHKYATIAGPTKSENAAKLDSPHISCLRQLYCPDCGQRLDTESVRFETMLSCCFPLLGLNTVYQCCLKRSIGRKVICNKCGSNLGYWKRT